MSAPFTAFPIPTLTTKDWALGRGCIFLSDFGVVGDGSTDDTTALNAAFASVKGQGATVIWDVGFCRTTDTVNVGDPVGGAGASNTFNNIIAPRGNQASGIFYHGPTDGRPALAFNKNKYFICQGLNINNQVGSKGTSVGIRLGGAGAGSSGTQTLAGIFNDCNVVGFATGITDGNFGASSEIMWNELSLIGNDIGWVSNDFNTLDHCFYVLNMAGNGVGLDSGAAEGYRVYGGSASSNTIDFRISGNAHCLVNGFRSEGGAIFCRGDNGGSISIIDCPMLGATSSSNSIDALQNGFDSITLSGCDISGWVNFKSRIPDNLVMINNGVIPEPTTHLPFVGLSGTTGHATLLRNFDRVNFPPLPLQDFIGELNAGNDSSGVGLGSLLLNDNTSIVPNVPLPGANSLPAPFGADYSAFQFIKQLSEAPTKGGYNQYVNTLVTNASTAAGNQVLHFASVPSWVVPAMWVRDLTGGNLPGFADYIDSVTSTTVTVHVAATGSGVANGSTIEFTSQFGLPLSGQNLRVSGTFATSNTLAFTFIRNVTGNTGTGQSQTLIATGGLFLPTDAGKRIKVPSKGNNGWTDWYGFCKEYTDSTHINVVPAGGQQAPNFSAGSGGGTITIGADEPDANYIVAGLAGNAATPESYSVTGQTTTGFTLHSSNATSTATVTAMIVR